MEELIEEKEDTSDVSKVVQREIGLDRHNPFHHPRLNQWVRTLPMSLSSREYSQARRSTGEIQNFRTNESSQPNKPTRSDHGQKFDVFLSSSGKQRNFARQLYRDLTNRRVLCFFDEISLSVGEVFPPRIFQAAETCRIAVLFLSKDFLESKWPMLELSTFVKARDTNPNLKILPLFFMISPQSLKKITADNEKWKMLEISEERRAEWHQALNAILPINGLMFGEGGNEVEFRDQIVKEIGRKLPTASPRYHVQGELRMCKEVADFCNTVHPNKKGIKVQSGSWTKGHVLGSGSFGTVYEGITDDGYFFAVKEISLVGQGSNGKQSISQLEQEVALLRQFKHKNIVQYLGTDKEADKLYIFLELVTQGSLASLYEKYNLKDAVVRAYTRQILTGLKYLHERNVIHRDIKCANILVDARGLIKLADFGLAKETSKLDELKSFKGSAYWMAPEVVNPRARTTYWLSADIWSLGCTVIEMLTRRRPYADLECYQALFKIGHGEPPPFPSTLSRDAKDFIQQCLQVEPTKRPSASELLDHPFVKQSFSADMSHASAH